MRKEKVYPPVRLAVPKGVVSKKYSLSDDQFYFLHILTREIQKSDSQKEKDDYVRLSIKLLEKQVGRNAKESVIDPLVDLKLVQIQTSKERGTEVYSAGNFSKGYRLTDQHRKSVIEDKLELVYIMGTTTLARRLFKLRIKRREEALQEYPYLQREYNWIRQLRFDTDKAMELHEGFLSKGRRDKGNYTKGTVFRVESDMLVLSKLSEGSFEFSSAGARVSTAVANTVSEFRCCLMDQEGNHYREIDLKSSQFLFLLKALYLRVKYQVADSLTNSLLEYAHESVSLEDEVFGTHTDLRQFCNVVLFDDVYLWSLIDSNLEMTQEEIWDPKLEANIKVKSSTPITRPNVSREERSDFKYDLLKYILYNYHTMRVDVKLSAAFRANFPSVLSFLEQCTIESARVRKSSETALLLQSYEACFVHQFALDRLQQAFPDRLFYTVHDSFGVPEDIVDECFDIIAKAVGDHLGIKDGSVVLKIG